MYRKGCWKWRDPQTRGLTPPGRSGLQLSGATNHEVVWGHATTYLRALVPTSIGAIRPMYLVLMQKKE